MIEVPDAICARCGKGPTLCVIPWVQQMMLCLDCDRELNPPVVEETPDGVRAEPDQAAGS